MNMKMGAVHSSVNLNCAVGAVFNEVEDFEILTVEKTEILHFWGYGIEVKSHTGTEYMKKITDSVELEDGIPVNVAVEGRVTSVS